MTNENNLAWRVAQLEKKVEGFDCKLDELMQNHIPHLDSELQSLKTKINVMTAINVGAIILGVIVTKIL
jgi:chaperonin cofactor prefoldin